MLNMDVENSGGGDFNMSSAIEDHMSEEDLGPEASQVPPRSKEISCFHASTKVRMYTTIPGAPQYKRIKNWSEETSSAQDDTGEIGWNQAKARSALWNVS